MLKAAHVQLLTCAAYNHVMVVDNCAYRKYFKVRYHQLGRDEINLEGFVVVQLNQHIQNDATSCGIYCLKVAIYLYVYSSYVFMQHSQLYYMYTHV